MIQEAAEREKVEAKVERQLERVQLQLAEFILPVISLNNQFFKAFERAVSDCSLETYIAAFAMKWFSPPAQPHVSVLNLGDPATLKAWAETPFVYTLPPEDIARLAADATKRARWMELVTHTLLQPLRELVPIVLTKVRLLARPQSCHSINVCRARDA